MVYKLLRNLRFNDIVQTTLYVAVPMVIYVHLLFEWLQMLMLCCGSILQYSSSQPQFQYGDLIVTIFLQTYFKSISTTSVSSFIQATVFGMQCKYINCWLNTPTQSLTHLALSFIGTKQGLSKTLNRDSMHRRFTTITLNKQMDMST